MLEGQVIFYLLFRARQLLVRLPRLNPVLADFVDHEPYDCQREGHPHQEF